MVAGDLSVESKNDGVRAEAAHPEQQPAAQSPSTRNEATALLAGGVTSHEAYAEVIRRNPSSKTAVITLLHQALGKLRGPGRPEPVNEFETPVCSSLVS